MLKTRFILILLFFPVLVVFYLAWIIYEKFWGKKQNQKFRKNQELKKKWQKHLRNFDPSRVKNKFWARNLNKKKKNLLKKPKSKKLKIIYD